MPGFRTHGLPYELRSQLSRLLHIPKAPATPADLRWLQVCSRCSCALSAPLPCVLIYRQAFPTQLLPLAAHWLKHLLPLAAQLPGSHLSGHRSPYFLGKINPSTLHYVVNEGVTLHRAPGIGPDWLTPTGISSLPDPITGSWMGT